MSNYELVWCSGWEEAANDHLPAALGVGPLDFIGFDAATAAGTSMPGHWKLGAIDAYAGPHRALAWIDDVFNDACHTWAANRPGPTLLVATEPASGLRTTHAQRLRDWAQALGAVGEPGP